MKTFPNLFLFLAFSSLLFFFSNTLAQFSGPFAVSYSLGNTNAIEGFAITPISGSANFFTAAQYVTNNNTRQVLVTEFEPNGAEVWSRVYGNQNTQTYAYDIKAEPQGAIVVTGETNGAGSGDFDGFLMQLTPSGAIQWYSNYGIAQQNDGYHAVADYSGFAYAAIGYREVNNPAGVSRDMSFLIASNNTGSLFSASTYGGLLDDEGYDIISIGGGYFIGVGYARSYSNTGDADIFVVKFDSLANEVWSRVYGGIADDIAYGVVQVSPNLFAITGETSSFNNANEPQVFLLEIDSMGTIVNQDVYDNPALGGSGRDILVLNNGDYLISGGSTITPEAIMLRLDNNRDVDWNWSYSGDIIRQVEDLGGQFLGVGDYLDTTANSNELYYLHTAPNGNVSNSCGVYTYPITRSSPTFSTFSPQDNAIPSPATASLFLNDSAVSLIQDFNCYIVGVAEAETTNLTLSPNPASDQVLVKLENMASAGFSYQLMDALGERIMEGDTDQSQVRLDLGELSSGMYFLQVRIGENEYTKKLVKW